MNKKVKVVMHCCSSKGPDDPCYGKEGGNRWQLEEQSGVEIELVAFGGFLEGQKLQEFYTECKTADVVVTDAWNNPGYGATISSQESMARIVCEIKAKNPKVRVFSQLMEGADRVAVHRYAEPHQSYRDIEIALAIKMCAQEKKPNLKNVLVFDDNGRHGMTAVSQLSVRFNVMAVTSYDHAQALIETEKFDIVLLDLLVPASAKMMGGKGEKFIGQEMPVTPFLLLLALQRGVKRIGILTDAGHHDHPASACLDMFRGQSVGVGDVRIVLSNADVGEKDHVRTKYWDQVVEKLIPPTKGEMTAEQLEKMTTEGHDL